MDLNELAGAMFGKERLEDKAKLSTTSTISGVAVGNSQDGKVRVVVSDDITIPEAIEDADVTANETNEVELATEVHVEEGDSVSIGLVGAQMKSPRVTGVVGGGDRMQAQVENAETLAGQAEEVARRTNEHFWTDGQGAHVTEYEQDLFTDRTKEEYQSGANVLINSVGQLFRDGLTNLLALLPAQKTVETFTGDGSTRTFDLQSTPNLKRVYKVWVDGGLLSTDDYSISGTALTLRTAPAQDVEVKIEYRSTDATSGIAIYDGEGNESSNIVASFTNTGVRVGAETSPRMLMDGTGITGYNEEGVSLFDLSMDGSITTTEERKRIPVPNMLSYYPLGIETPFVERTIVLGGATGTIDWVEYSGEEIAFAPSGGFGAEAPTVMNMTIERFVPYSQTVFLSLSLQPFDADSDWSYEASLSAALRNGGTYELKFTYNYTASTRELYFAVYADRSAGGGTDSLNTGWQYVLYTSRLAAPAFALGTRSDTSADVGIFSSTLGEGLIASARDQVATGRFNIADTTSALIVGNGTDDSNRSNAFALDWDGNLETAGTVTAGGNLAAAGAFEVNTTDIDATLADNGVTSTRYVGDYMNDKNKRALGAMEVIVNPNGTISQQFYVRNYNTDGTSAGFHGLKIDAHKNGSQTVNLVGTGAKAAWLSALGLDQPLIKTQKQTVTVAANQVVLRDITAPTVSGYTFSHWLQPASSGHITSAYMADPTAQTTNLWVPGNATSSTRSFVVTAVYYLATS